MPLLPAIILILIFALLSNIAQAKPACELSVGVVPQFEQRRLNNTWQPILHRLSEETGCRFTLIGSKTILEFEKSFKQGAYDLVYLNPYHAIMAYDTQGYLPLVRSGSNRLKGILTVHKDSNINDLTDLQGQTIAFPSPNALGASLLMRAELKRKHNIDIVPLYVKTHSSVYLHVAKKLAVAGGGVMRTLKEQKTPLQNLLTILYTTTPVPAHPLAIHPRVDAPMRDMIQRTWLKMEQDSPEIFADIPMQQAIATRIDDYQILRELELEKFVGDHE